MASSAYRANYSLIDWSRAPEIARAAPAEVQRSSFPCPRIASDVMDAVQSQITGRMYDSKSALRAEYRRHNAVEVGNDPARLRPREKRKPDDRAVSDAIDRAEARFNRGERALKKS